MKKLLPSVSACRQLVPKLAADEKGKLKSRLSGKKIFLVADESEVQRKKFVNVLAGSLEFPDKEWLYDCLPLVKSLDSTMVCQIAGCIRDLNAARDDFLLLLSTLHEISRALCVNRR